jgi:hypothetical protein
MQVGSFSQEPPALKYISVSSYSAEPNVLRTGVDFGLIRRADVFVWPQYRVCMSGPTGADWKRRLPVFGRFLFVNLERRRNLLRWADPQFKFPVNSSCGGIAAVLQSYTASDGEFSRIRWRVGRNQGWRADLFTVWQQLSPLTEHDGISPDLSRAGLPTNDPQRRNAKYAKPPFGFLPPWQLILGAALIWAVCPIAYYGYNWRWFIVAMIIGLIGALIFLNGIDRNRQKCENCQQFRHNSVIVPQESIDNVQLLGYSKYIRS